MELQAYSIRTPELREAIRDTHLEAKVEAGVLTRNDLQVRLNHLFALAWSHGLSREDQSLYDLIERELKENVS